MRFSIGQRVVCIDNNNGDGKPLLNIIVGKFYTIYNDGYSSSGEYYVNVSDANGRRGNYYATHFEDAKTHLNDKIQLLLSDN